MVIIGLEISFKSCKLEAFAHILMCKDAFYKDVTKGDGMRHISATLPNIECPWPNLWKLKMYFNVMACFPLFLIKL